MKDILLRHGNEYIECEIDGVYLTYTHSCEPTCHYVLELRNEDSYDELKRWINEDYELNGSTARAYAGACELLSSVDIYDFCVEDSGRMYFDLRTREEIEDYEKEAWDKVWLMRSCVISRREPVHEASRAGMERILDTYDDIPKDGYDTWECGYWNGILASMRWVLGEEKDFLDT